MEFLLNWALDIIRSPGKVTIACIIFIVSYYAVSALCLNATKKGKADSWWFRNSLVDKVTSFLWILFAVMLIWSLIELSMKNQLSLPYLVGYYFLFLFLFAFCYGLLEWHFEGVLTGVDATTWEAEVQYLIISIQTQTTLGYTRARPGKLITEAIASIQALLGLLFAIVFIAKAVNPLA